MTDLNKERELYRAAKARIEKEEFFCRDWDLWKACAELKQAEINKLQAELQKAKAQAVPDSSYGVILTCEQLREALEFGAPDLKIETNEFSDEQMGTELAIIYQENGHSGEGFYSYYVECPDEGSIKLGESESGAEG
ncbi:hypothetical protein ABFO76_03605 [Acinetobacter baumannii]